MIAVWRTSWARLPRRALSDIRALLHELRGADVRAQAVNAIAESRVKWRSAACVFAAAVCVAAAAWVVTGGQRAFLLSSVDLGFHELGHLLFAWAPGLIPPLSGSIVQVAVPLGLAIYFLIRREAYASALVFAWAATSAANVSVYAADAESQALVLLGNGRHDWAWVFGSIGHLDWAVPFSNGIRWFAVALAVIGFIVAVVPLLAPRARERAEARQRAERGAREAALKAQAPRREPRNVPPEPPRGRVPERPLDRQAPPAPAGRF